MNKKIQNQAATTDASEANQNTLLMAMRLKLLLKVSSAVLTIVAAGILVLGIARPFIVTVSFVDQSDFVSRFHLIAEMNSTVVVAASLLIPAVFYFVMSTSGYGAFLKDVTSGKGRFRWMNYGLSNCVLMILCAISVGFGDIVVLSLMAMLIVCAAAFGFINQVINMRRKRTVWDGFNAMAWVSVGLTAIITGSLLLGAILDINELTIWNVMPITVFIIYQIVLMFIIHHHFTYAKRSEHGASTEALLISTSTIAKIVIAALTTLGVNNLV